MIVTGSSLKVKHFSLAPKFHRTSINYLSDNFPYTDLYIYIKASPVGVTDPYLCIFCFTGCPGKHRNDYTVPLQWRPSSDSWNPRGHVHTKDPGRFLQRKAHVSIPSRHSSVSIDRILFYNHGVDCVK